VSSTTLADRVAEEDREQNRIRNQRSQANGERKGRDGFVGKKMGRWFH